MEDGEVEDGKMEDGEKRIVEVIDLCEAVMILVA